MNENTINTQALDDRSQRYYRAQKAKNSVLVMTEHMEKDYTPYDILKEVASKFLPDEKLVAYCGRFVDHVGPDGKMVTQFMMPSTGYVMNACKRSSLLERFKEGYARITFSKNIPFEDDPDVKETVSVMYEYFPNTRMYEEYGQDNPEECNNSEDAEKDKTVMKDHLSANIALNYGD